MKKILLLSLAVMPAVKGLAQNDLGKLFGDSSSAALKHQPVIATFQDEKIVLSNSVKTLHKHDLLFNVAHRFDDIAGSNGGIKTFFGFDNTTDINIGFAYGISDRFTVGAARFKGAPVFAVNPANNNPVYVNSLTQLYELSLKYQLLEQTGDNRLPVTVTLFGNTVVSTMKASTDPYSDAHFGGFGDRMSFAGQALIARKFSDRLSLQLSPTFVRRNFVAFQDMNNIFGLGVGGRWKFTHSMAIIAEYFHPFRSQSSIDYYKAQGLQFYDPIAIGWEIETGGHVFHINFTNSTAIVENQFLPYTTRTWTKGQFRWGFNIARTFSLFTGKKWKPRP